MPTMLALIDVSPVFSYPSADQAQYLDLIFRCRYLDSEARVTDAESSDVRWFDQDALPMLDDYIGR